MTAFERAEQALQHEDSLKEMAKKRQLLSTRLPRPQVLPKLEGQRYERVRERLARMAGISHGTLDKVKYIVANGDEAIKEKLRNGAMSIHHAYMLLKETKSD